MASGLASDIPSFTTLMVRNMPRRFTAWDVVQQLERVASRRDFDFVYVPWDKTSPTNMGFAFVNFFEHHVASAAMSQLNGCAWGDGKVNRMRRPIEVKPAHVQGTPVNLRRFHENVAKRCEAKPEHAPLIFEDGYLMTLEFALKKYCNVNAGAAGLSHTDGSVEEQQLQQQQQQKAPLQAPWQMLAPALQSPPLSQYQSGRQHDLQQWDSSQQQPMQIDHRQLQLQQLFLELQRQQQQKQQQQQLQQQQHQMQLQQQEQEEMSLLQKRWELQQLQQQHWKLQQQLRLKEEELRQNQLKLMPTQAPTFYESGSDSDGDTLISLPPSNRSVWSCSTFEAIDTLPPCTYSSDLTLYELPKSEAIEHNGEPTMIIKLKV